MENYSLFVWSEPRPGEEEAYNLWYDNVHLGDVCSLPEFTGAKRFHFAEGSMSPRSYLAIYDVTTDRPETLIERLAADTANMDISRALDMESVILSIMRKL